MTETIRLRAVFIEETLAAFNRQGIDQLWPEDELLEITTDEPPLTIEDVSIWIEGRVEHLYSLQSGGEDQAQVQVVAIRKRGDQQILDWEKPASQLLQDGDCISLEANAATASARGPMYTEEMLKKIRAQLRFDLNDRVVCFCGPRWLSGHVVGTAVPDDGAMLPYLVKTDPLPGLPSGTISVPSDDDGCCAQEICFHPFKELHLVKACAPLLSGATRPKLRFGVGDSVVCRVRNNISDGLEQWVDGTVGAVWPELPGPRQWEVNDVCGEYPAAVAYKINLAPGGWVFCHKDHHTLIRRKGWEPQQRAKGLSKRMEVRRLKDGSKEQVDHQTERRKRLMDDIDSEEDTDEN